MKRFIPFVLALFCLFIIGCSSGGTDHSFDASKEYNEFIEGIEEEARIEGYDDGFSEGYEAAVYDCTHAVYRDLHEAGLTEAMEHAERIETIIDAPEDFDTNEIWQHISAIQDYLDTVDGIVRGYEEYGIEP